MTENPLIVGIDGSPEAREALRWASRLAAGRGRDIIAVHALGLLESIDGAVVSADNNRAEIEEMVQRDWCSALRPNGNNVHAVVCDGDPIDVLVEMAVEKDAAMLLVGSRGAGAASALALGSTSLHLVQESPVPVLVVPDPEQAARHLALQRILVAIDGTPACCPAIDLAADLAAQFEARVELVLAVEDPPASRATPVRMAGDWAAPAQARRDAEVYATRSATTGCPCTSQSSGASPRRSCARWRPASTPTSSSRPPTEPAISTRRSSPASAAASSASPIAPPSWCPSPAPTPSRPGRCCRRSRR